ncbi:hypothetical protein PRZ48_005437 [Zasmidium cellare]|uniref:RING-type domain-containing protein n=1 Tax=Zasmidium cellare TaxID=395010 RepID=A0ABR0ETJ7_ZASCE|nr:hypothetical protein PRZ48_005437 [Zasmidium cellare]
MKVKFSKSEQRQYRRIMKRSRKAIDDAVSGRTGASSRQTMLKVLLRLRIFCNQGTFTSEETHEIDDALDADEQLTLLEEQEAAFCDACSSAVTMLNQLEDPTSGVLGQCSHMLCRTCYDDRAQETGDSANYDCPVCEKRTRLEQLQTGSGIEHGARALSQHSSKLNALTDDLLKSQGSETPEKRLNITAASRVHILEPQWNPAVEDQAVGRAVRLGQLKNATVIRYIVEDSVEKTNKQIQGYQKRKMRLAAGGFEHRYDIVPEENIRLNAAYLAQT